MRASALSAQRALATCACLFTMACSASDAAPAESRKSQAIPLTHDQCNARQEAETLPAVPRGDASASGLQALLANVSDNHENTAGVSLSNRLIALSRTVTIEGVKDCGWQGDDYDFYFDVSLDAENKSRIRAIVGESVTIPDRIHAELIPDATPIVAQTASFRDWRRARSVKIVGPDGQLQAIPSDANMVGEWFGTHVPDGARISATGALVVERWQLTALRFGFEIHPVDSIRVLR